jgi:transposase
MRYIGLDVHKEFCQASVLDDNGIELVNERFDSTLEALNRFLDRFTEARFVLESTGIWEFIYEGIEARGYEVQLAHPLKVRAIAEYQRRPQAQLIATIPGIGYYGALLICAKIADVSRFATPEQLCSYAGLTPTVSQSASSIHYDGVSKEGSKHLRWILIESMHVHRRYAPESALSAFASRIERRKGKQKATTAAARKLLHIIYRMLVRNEQYHGHGSNLGLKPAALTA